MSRWAWEYIQSAVITSILSFNNTAVKIDNKHDDSIHRPWWNLCIKQTPLGLTLPGAMSIAKQCFISSYSCIQQAFNFYYRSIQSFLLSYIS